MMEIRLLRISTPLRTIVIEKISDAGLNPMEKEMMDRYEKLHHQLFDYIGGWRKAEADLRALKRGQERLQKEADALQRELKGHPFQNYLTPEVLDALPYKEEIMSLDPQHLLDYQQDIQYFFQVHQENILAFTEDYKKANDGSEALLALYEDFDNNYYSKVMIDFEHTTLNLIHLDDEFNEFNIMMEEATNLVNKTTDEYKIVFATYEQLVQEVEAICKNIGQLYEEASKFYATGIKRKEELN